ncbi:LpxL/LpxP family acyltransferase [Francisella sciaenopsi]|uniref:Lysophospholipid acyltransferase family protein n=1 Tax=Francisella sciaenopsi TaxID=3055034 RepID=A0ABQ6PH85_9GAMM
MDKSLLKPKYWGLWVVIWTAKILVNILPYKILMHLAVGIGFLMKPLMKRRLEITKINLKIAFPNKSDREIENLTKECYKSASMAGFESLISWFMTDKNFQKIPVDTSEFETFMEVHNNKNKTLLALGFHFHCLEIAGRYCGSNLKKISIMYQKHKNPLMEHIITSSRKKHIDVCFQRKNIVSAIKSLKKGYTLWYAPDQDFKEHSVFAPFFNKKCSTLTVTPWLAKKTGATVIPLFYVRKNDLSGYKLISGEPVEFTGDEYNDAALTNKTLEKFILRYPEQYLWQHRRYKTRPPGEEKIY